MALPSDLKLAAQILGLVILVITLILTFRRLLTNNTGSATHILPGRNLASGNGVISGSQDNI